MKVYVLQQGSWQDYEGGGDSTIGIFSTREKAVAIVERYFKQHKMEVPEPKEDGTWIIGDDKGASHDWFYIQEMVIDDDDLAEVGDWVQCVKEFKSEMFPQNDYGKLGENYRVDEVVNTGWGSPIYYRLSFFNTETCVMQPLCPFGEEEFGEPVNIERFEKLI